MEHLIAWCLTHCSWVRGVSIRCHPFQGMANHGESVLEKLLGCLHIPFLASP
jgi:hypothetical protein